MKYKQNRMVEQRINNAENEQQQKSNSNWSEWVKVFRMLWMHARLICWHVILLLSSWHTHMDVHSFKVTQSQGVFICCFQYYKTIMELCQLLSIYCEKCKGYKATPKLYSFTCVKKFMCLHYSKGQRSQNLGAFINLLCFISTEIDLKDWLAYWNYLNFLCQSCTNVNC